MSTVYNLYKSYTHPLARIAQGLPTSWEPIVVARKSDDFDWIREAIWSPCGRLIAVAWVVSRVIEILDGATLERLDTFNSPQDRIGLFSFSPDGRSLAQWSDELELTSWDLQTGGPVGTIYPEPPMYSPICFSSTYSTDGKMVAIAHVGEISTTTTISTYNLLHRTYVYSHCVLEGSVVAPIWTHGEFLRCITVKPGFITIWEAGFTSIHTLVEVQSLLAPGNINCASESLFLPPLSRLAYIYRGVLVWDAQNSKLLLNFVDAPKPMGISFSPDGQFFACGTYGCEIYLWKDSPTGYVLHQKVVSTAHFPQRPFLSPNGESIVVLSPSATQLWRTIDSNPSLSSIPTDEWTSFILEFSPDKKLAAVAWLQENIATVLDPKSGDLLLIVDTGMKVLSLRVTGSTIIVVGDGKVVTWGLPTGDHALNIRVNINDSVHTTMFGYSLPNETILVPFASISHDLNHIAVLTHQEGLNIYDGSTGKQLANVTTHGFRPWFTPDGHQVWCIQSYGVSGPVTAGWMIIKDSKSDLTKLEPLGQNERPSGGFPWLSCDYQVTADGWVVSPYGKRLFWLPHRWRFDETSRTWGGQFLGLLERNLPEAIILELD